MRIMNAAGEAVGTADSDAEAVRWWHDQGRSGDYLEDTGEKISDFADSIIDDVDWYIDRDGAVHVREES